MNFGLLLRHPRLLRVLAWKLRLYQTSGLQALVRRSGLVKLLPGTLPAWEALMPSMPSAADRAPLPPLVPAEGPRRARVALLTGCVQSVVFGAHNRATARVLARNGCEVVIPRAQACCGALNAHGGDHGGAIEMAKRTIEVFEAAKVDAIVVNTSGCGAHMKAYGTLLADDPAWAERARRFSAQVRDLAEFLAQEPLRGPLRPVPMTVTYHDPCHVVHGQKIRKEPRQLLAQIPGLKVVDLPESDWCCGSAGIYNLTQPEMATRLLARKVGHVLSTGAEAVVTANPGCILQIQQGLRECGRNIEVLHLIEILDRASEGATHGRASGATAPSDASPKVAPAKPALGPR
jgi:glycolate oxidase iron-sulfur subunit